MSNVELVEITTDSPADLIDAWVAVRTAAHAVDEINTALPWRDSNVGGLAHPVPGGVALVFLLRRDGEAVGHARIGMPTQSNTTVGWIALGVVPELRRQGIGRAALDLLFARLRAEGRTRAMSDAALALPDGVQRDEAGAAFLAATGFRQVGSEVRRDIDLSTVDVDVETRLHEAALAKAGEDYEVVRFTEPAPEEYLGDLAVMNGRLSEDTAGYIENWEPAPFDTDKIIAYQDAAAARLFRRHHVAVRHKPSGHLVAWSFLAVVAEDGRHADHEITVVIPEHRGHRLGVLVKTGLHRYARETEPNLRWIQTWNAAENGHMIAINEELGFEPIETYAEYAKDL
ncbi:GNAT family N-acetyltransferase [Phytomonospora endophytica]|uniref:GNAT superfamily N-acetyltransferase n=1 Tax=Phytomonospora endophytica TaxID=714109 RepID=A0A841FQ04_9ACTN|nr:GNAT family N-acetyltransferase [Phytomonospora endophytica]MBB6039381.1 GNAT superfamily N-acetyltransferase [Phytomonospora endophytica]GIG69676.1 GNAT family N-acetyltransferase [Phytomonospora endophytica]